MSAKVTSLKARHDELLASLTEYLEDPEADLALAEEKEAEYKTVKAELDAAVAVQDRISTYTVEHKSRSEAKPLPFAIHTGGNKSGIKSIGQRVVESSTYKDFSTARKFGSLEFDDANIKTTLTSTGLTSYERPSGVVPFPNQQPTLADLMPQYPTTHPTVRLLVESAHTNYMASPIAENGTKPEGTLSLTEQDFPVRKIAEVLPVTMEMLEDYPVVQAKIDNNLVYDVLIAEENQMINGDGSGATLTGFLNTSGVGTQGYATSYAKTVRQAMTKCYNVGFAQPSAIVVNHADWEKFCLEADLNGQYFGGGPFSAAYGNPGDPTSLLPRYWGMKVLPTSTIAQGTALLGAFDRWAEIYRRMGVRIDMTNSDGTTFRSNILTIRAESRLALAITRPKAFVKITGIS